MSAHSMIRPLLALLLTVACGGALRAEDAPAVDTKPRAAEIAKLASKNLLLGIGRAGDALVAVGDRGNILLSADGEKWEQVASPVNVTLTAVAFADAKTGWAVGHDATILKTADGGRTWTVQRFKPELGQPLLNLLALDAQRVFAIGAYGMFLKTDDGGATWADVPSPPLLEDGLHLNGMVRLGSGELFIAGETGLVAVSADGVTWERLAAPYEGSLFGVLPRGDKGALVFGLRGNVLMTDDVRSGSWTPVDIGSVQSMFGGAVLADGRVVLVGSDGEIVFITPAGAVSRAVLEDGVAGPGSGSLSGVLAWKDGLRIVGESGVAAAPLSK